MTLSRTGSNPTPFGFVGGSQYQTAIFVADDGQKQAAEASKAALQKNKPFTGDVQTLITRVSEFYAAEDYHQDYLQKNPDGYTCHYLRK